VDIDIESARRPEVLQYLIDKHGKERVAQIRTRSELSGKSAWRAACKAHLVSLSDEDRIAKLITGNLQEAVQDAAIQAELRAGFQTIMDHALWMEQKVLLAGYGIHAGGVVISKDNLFEHLPMAQGDALETCVAIDMKRVEKQKFVKFDLLGVKMMDVLKACRQAAGIYSLAEIPLDDTRVYQFLSEGHSFGIFQFNKCGEILRSMGVRSVEDLTAINALNRPGPMAEIPEYTLRMKGKPYDSYGPELDKVLGLTYGILIYQETIMKLTQVMSGFSMGKADLLRRGISKKDPKLIESMKAEFVDGAKAKGYEESFALEIFALIEKFADYGFCKSHALRYAIMAYRCAYFKCYHPVLYLTELLKVHAGDQDDADNSPLAIRAECKRLGIRLLPPDINTGELSYQALHEQSAIRYGFSSLKGIGEAAAVKILDGRPYRSFEDFVRRAGVTKKVAEVLVKSGAFDALEGRTGLLASYPVRLDWSERDTFTLFPALPASLLAAPEVDISPLDILRYEAETLGSYLSDHPLRHYSQMLSRYGCVDIHRLQRKEAYVGGIISKISEFKSKKGAFVTIEDESGSVEAMLFSSTVEKLEVPSMKALRHVPLIAELRWDESKGKYIVRSLVILEGSGDEVVIEVEKPEQLARLTGLLRQARAGAANVVVIAPYLRQAFLFEGVEWSEDYEMLLGA
jgi:DNA polymerase-3 subunit alpha